MSLIKINFDRNYSIRSGYYHVKYRYNNINNHSIIEFEDINGYSKFFDLKYVKFSKVGSLYPNKCYVIKVSVLTDFVFCEVIYLTDK